MGSWVYRGTTAGGAANARHGGRWSLPWHASSTTDILREIKSPRPRMTYIFKHALVQEVAYTSTPQHVRREYHSRIAQVLRKSTCPRPSAATQPELLADHYTQAEHNARAIEYGARAGHYAIERSAYVEAIQHLTTGLTLVPTCRTVRSGRSTNWRCTYFGSHPAEDERLWRSRG